MRSTIALFAFALATAAPVHAGEPVPVSSFRGVELRGGGDVLVRHGPVQRVTLIAGSTRFTNIRVEPRGRLKIDACNSQCPRNYDLRIEIQSPRVPDVAISGGGAIRVAPGFPAQEQLATAINGGGEINVRSVSAGNVRAAVNGGGKVLTGNSTALMAAISGGGEVTYAGNPQVTSAVQGGGKVRRE